MKSFAILGIILVVCAATVQAETMYVGEIIEITLRTGPGIDHKVTAMVRSGQAVEVLESGTEWIKVRLPNEKEGYVLSRFITNKKPNELLLRELEKRYKTLEEKAEALRQENLKRETETQNLLAELAQKDELLKQVTESYETLRQNSAEFLNLKSNYQKMSTDLSEQSQKAEILEEALTKLQKGQIFRWVLTGAGILLVGFLIGMSSKRQRRRSSLL